MFITGIRGWQSAIGRQTIPFYACVIPCWCNSSKKDAFNSRCPEAPDRIATTGPCPGVFLGVRLPVQSGLDPHKLPLSK